VPAVVPVEPPVAPVVPVVGAVVVVVVPAVVPVEPPVAPVVPVVGAVVVVVVLPLAVVQVLEASMTSWAATGPTAASIMCTALTVRVCPSGERVCWFNTTEPSGPSEMVMLGIGLVGIIGAPGSTKVAMDVVPVGVAPLALQVELITVPLIPAPGRANEATDAELIGEVGEAVALSPLAVTTPAWLTEASEADGGAFGVGATVIGPVALIPKAVPEPGVAAPEVPFVAMRKIPNSRKAAEATPATFDL